MFRYFFKVFSFHEEPNWSRDDRESGVEERSYRRGVHR